jgi:hypothetical protein
MPEHAGRDAVGHESAKVGPNLIEFGRRAAMRWPPDTSLRPATAGAAEARQTDRDLTEQNGDPVRAVVLDLARCRAGPALRPLGRMVTALRRDDLLLNSSQKPLALHLRQTQIRKVAKITEAVDLHHIDAATFYSSLHQAQNPPHP